MDLKVTDRRASTEIISKRDRLARIIRPILVGIQDPYEGGGEPEIETALASILDAVRSIEEELHPMITRTFPEPPHNVIIKDGATKLPPRKDGY